MLQQVFNLRVKGCCKCETAKHCRSDSNATHQGFHGVLLSKRAQKYAPFSSCPEPSW